MAKCKRLVIFAEGHGGVEATKSVINKVVNKCQAYDSLYIDDNVFRMGGLTALINRHMERDWLRMVAAANKRSDVGAMLLVLDGDYNGKKMMTSKGELSFCAKTYAGLLAEKAREEGAGTKFSLAVVFAMAEFESWLIAGCSKLSDLRGPHENADFLENE